MNKNVYLIPIVCIFIIAITFAGCIESSYKKTEVVLTKLDSTGNVQWTTIIDNRDYATAKSLSLSFNRVIQTSDNGFVIAGFFFNSSGKKNLRLIKTDTVGNITWDQRIPNLQGDVLTIYQRDDDGYCVLSRDGNNYSFDYSGTLEDLNIATKLATEQIDSGSINTLATKDGGSLIGQSHYASPFLIEKKDENGSVVWNSTLGLCDQPYCYDILAMYESEIGEYEVVYLSYDRGNTSSDPDNYVIVTALLGGNGQIKTQEETNATALPEWVFVQAGSSRELISRMMAEVPAISSLSGYTEDQRDLIDCIIKTNDNGYAVLGSRYYL